MTFEKNKIYEIDSGLGGVFDIRFKGKTPEGKLKFKVVNKDFREIEYLFSEEQAIKNVRNV